MFSQTKTDRGKKKKEKKRGHLYANIGGSLQRTKLSLVETGDVEL